MPGTEFWTTANDACSVADENGHLSAVPLPASARASDPAKPNQTGDVYGISAYRHVIIGSRVPWPIARTLGRKE
nr:hypothetical protein GCM10025732_03890 [Glycomyces mayteni]